MGSVDERVARYAKVIHPGVANWASFAAQARAVMALADSEQAELMAEVKRLREQVAYYRDNKVPEPKAETLNCPVCGNGEEGECICSLADAFAEAEWNASGLAVREGPWSAVGIIKRRSLMIKALPQAHAYAQGHRPDQCRPETCGGSGAWDEGCENAVRR